MNPYDAVGLVGVITYLTPFVLVQMKKMEPNELSYSLLNLCGSSCFLISLTNDFNLSAAIANTIWVCFSLLGIFRFFRDRTREKQLQVS
ncbi:hypothetical protein M3P05_01345 [Sansalvadorimonas sp. 2012CJ34-2]|uniref:CBU-0592-like domain-containing protein n=1 Tax=Parendozoicomonas callyspongiae TaxID=2942213 RepID=A0ABT0PBD7_9GAMM|nr:hypothetical protein [Sansalvadorimonas sp. 2012CJ34-2]MCL6268598.1 hypothetical protein [Sansalvadorimonas sp. 2012CJ34-2]